MSALKKELEPELCLGSVAIVEDVERNPLSVFTDPERFDQFLAAVKTETGELVPDLTTETGRKAIASMAYKVARSKTAIDAAGKTLNEDAQAKIKKVNAARTHMRETLDALRDKVRKPLSDWEAAEKVREAKAEAILLEFRNLIATGSPVGTSIEAITDRIAEIEATPIERELFLEDKAWAMNQKDAALARLQGDLEKAKQAEKDAAELVELRREREERAQADAKAAEEKRLAEAEAARQEELKAAAEKAAETARLEAEEKAKQDLADAKAESDRRLAEVERQQQEERNKVEAQKRADREADEKRQANTRHRNAVMKKATISLSNACDLDGEVAAKIVEVIADQQVTNIKIEF
jgi:DNA repair exonuclease SbcCD ATPase subunit